MAAGRSRLIKWLPLWLLLVVIATVAAELLQDRFGDRWWLNIVRAVPVSLGVVFVVHMEDRQRRRSTHDAPAVGEVGEAAVWTEEQHRRASAEHRREEDGR